MHLIHRINSPLAGLCLLLTSLFIYTSCSKGEKTALPQGDYVIVATFEPSSGQGTKTSLENTTETTKGVFWSDDDVIKVSNLEGATPSTSEYTLSSGAGTSSGVFSGDVAPGTKTGGFYPSTAVVRFSKSDDYACVISAVIPSVQKYSVGSFANNANLAAAYAENGNALTFKNVSGLLKLQLKGSAKIASITVSSSSDNLAGNVEIGLDKTYYTPSIISITEPVKSITLDCDDAGGVQLNTGTSTPFYIMVPPGAFSAGFTVTITDTDGNSMTKATTRDNTRNQINA